MILKKLIVGLLETNCYIAGDEKTRKAICIDPGDDAEKILSAINKAGLTLEYIINTHGHFDHIGGNGLLKGATNAKLAIHGDDVILLENVAAQSSVFGVGTVSSPQADLLLKDNDTIDVGTLTFRVIHTPGHTRGGISLFLKNTESADKEELLFTGDTLFAGSIGRTDLPGGSHKDLIASIRDKILPLGDRVKLLPGHGPETFIEKEKEGNPFLERSEGL